MSWDIVKGFRTEVSILIISECVISVNVIILSVATNSTDPETNIEIVASRIEIPPDAFREPDTPYVFNHYNEPVLFPLVIPDDVNASEFDMVADSEVIGFTIPGVTIMNLSKPIKYTVQSFRGRNGLVSE